VKSWCLPKPSGHFVAKMEDVLNVYQRPYAPLRPVVCVDELSKTLHTTPRGALPADARGLVRQDYEYHREGTCNIFLALEPLAGIRRVRVTERRTYRDFAEFLQLLVDEWYPEAERVVLVTDNLNIHCVGALYERFAPAEAARIASRLEWHYTPEHGSWLNAAECELSVFVKQCLKRRLGRREEVAQEAEAWEDDRNQPPSLVRWHFTTSDARIKLLHLYPQLQKPAPSLPVRRSRRRPAPSAFSGLVGTIPTLAAKGP
jgi:hypothetical protein